MQPLQNALQNAPFSNNSSTFRSNDNWHSLPRAFNDGNEVVGIFTKSGVNKSNYSIIKTIYLAAVAVMFLVMAGMFSLTAAGGLSSNLRTEHPVVPKLLVGLTFPAGLVFILMFGGELFT